VAFYDGGSKIGEVATAPFELAYNASVAKTYNFKAIATDDKGATGTSPTVGVTVGTAVNAAPKVSLAVSPTTQAAPGPVTLTATASDTDGTIAKVAFYNGGTKISEDLTAPYTATFTTTTTNTVYKFTAVATDDKCDSARHRGDPSRSGSVNAAPEGHAGELGGVAGRSRTADAHRERHRPRRNDPQGRVLPRRDQDLRGHDVAVHGHVHDDDDGGRLQVHGGRDRRQGALDHVDRTRRHRRVGHQRGAEGLALRHANVADHARTGDALRIGVGQRRHDHEGQLLRNTEVRGRS
jgi:hypothetical protein